MNWIKYTIPKRKPNKIRSIKVKGIQIENYPISSTVRINSSLGAMIFSIMVLFMSKNITYIERLPIDKAKIARKFVQELN